MQNAFTDLLSRQQATFSGPKATYNVEPALQGYFFGVFKLPDPVVSKLKSDGPSTYLKTNDGEYVLSAAIRSIDIPNLFDIQSASKTGLAGTKFTVPTAITTPENLTISFYEYYGYIIMKMLYAWTSLIFHPVTGLSQLTEMVQSNYKATLDIAFFDPTGNRSTAALRCFGVWPQHAPTSTLGADITANGLVEHSVQFFVDRIITLPCLEGEMEGILASEVANLTASVDQC